MKLLLAVLCAMALSGCVEELQHDLSEQDANDIMALLIDNGVGAKKTKEESGNEPRYVIAVPKGDYATSVRLLREYSLPRPMSGGLGDFRKNKGMIPTQTEEKAMWHEAVAGEIANSLNKVEGVLEARVIVALPEMTDLTQPDQKPKASASVFVKYRPRDDGSSPITEDKVRQFVVTATSVEIEAKNVTVLFGQPDAQDAAKLDARTRLQEVLGLTMTASSATTFKMMMGVVSLIIVALAGGLTMQFLRGGGNSSRAGRVRKTEG